MKAKIFVLFLVIVSVQSSYAQPHGTITSASPNPTPEQQEIINLSKQKWDWMADKNVDSLNVLFDDKCHVYSHGRKLGKNPGTYYH